MAVLDGMQRTEPLARRPPRLHLLNSIYEIGLVRITDRGAAIQPPFRHHAGGIDGIEFGDSLPDLMQRIFQIGAKAYEGLNHRHARNHSDPVGAAPGSAIPPAGLRLRLRRRGLRSGSSIFLRVSSSAFWKLSHHSAISASTSPLSQRRTRKS